MIKILIILALMLILPFYGAVGQTSGCTDPAATNYDPGATINNGSCLYPPLTLTANLKYNLGSTLVENSGMVFWNDKLWMHNDGGGAAAIYETDTSGTILRTITVSNAVNEDWEDIAQDDTYLYIGDFGNNNTGNRTNLKIYRVLKADVLATNSVMAEIISFSYPEQVLGASTSNSTDYDCEAMVVKNGKIYLFTKQWVSQRTSLYELPATPGSYGALLLFTENVGGLITGADIDVSKNMIVLTGYNAPFLNRFIYLMYDFTTNAFFGANKRKITVSGSRQTESVAFRNEEYIYIANENSFFGPQRVESINLTNVLHPYLSLLPITNIELKARTESGYVHLEWNIEPRQEFWKGELQRKNRTDATYETLFSFNHPTGVYDDHTLAGGENFYYRVKALDRNAIASFGLEQKIRMPGLNKSKISYIAKEIRIQLPSSSASFQIKVVDMMGRMMEKLNTVQKSLSINAANFPRGIYQVNIERNNYLENQYRFFKN